MITHEEALKLLHKHGIGGFVLKHILKVNQISVYLAKKLKEKGENVNVELTDIASLLQDIGKKLSDSTPMNHVDAGVKILNDEGMRDIGEIIKKHSINAIVEEDKIPTTWEEKLIFYTDRRVIEDKLVSLDERITDLRTRYPDIEKFLWKAVPKIAKLEEEIFSILDISKDLTELDGVIY